MNPLPPVRFGSTFKVHLPTHYAPVKLVETQATLVGWAKDTYKADQAEVNPDDTITIRFPKTHQETFVQGFLLTLKNLGFKAAVTDLPNNQDPWVQRVIQAIKPPTPAGAPSS
ncbi:MAG: hypothetical protein IPK79_08220 [Vampirovibrionales bacterium]|nr:hypothetical protein [Vampirovibrionales bacterium]